MSTGLLLLYYYYKQKSANKNKKRLYYTTQTLVSPYQSQWRHQLLHGDDMSFISSTGFNKEIFRELEREFMQNLKVDFIRCKLSAADILGLSLEWLVNPHQQKDLQKNFGLPPATVSRHLYHGLDCLLKICRNDSRCRISWPTEQEMAASAEVIEDKWGLKDVFGFMDGVYFDMNCPDNEEDKTLFYNSWKSGYTITNLLVFLPDGTVCYANLNNPGSVHDSTMAAGVYKKLQRGNHKYKLVADSAFQSTGAMKNKVLTPFKQGAKLSSHTPTRRKQLNKHRKITQVRAAAEWGMRAVQSVFKRLRSNLKFNRNFNSSLLELIIRLYNLRTRTMDRNQIKTVYDIIQDDLNNEDYIQVVLEENNVNNANSNSNSNANNLENNNAVDFEAKYND